MVVRMAPGRLPPLAHDAGATLGHGRAPGHRLPDDLVLLRPEGEGGRAEEPLRGRSEAPRDLREARDPATRTRDAGGRRGRCGLRQRLGRDHLQGHAGQGRGHLLLLFRGRAQSSRPGPPIPGIGRAGHGQFLRDAQLRGLHRRLVLLHPQGRALSARASRPIFASMPPRPASSNVRSSSPMRAAT